MWWIPTHPRRTAAITVTTRVAPPRNPARRRRTGGGAAHFPARYGAGSAIDEVDSRSGDRTGMAVPFATQPAARRDATVTPPAHCDRRERRRLPARAAAVRMAPVRDGARRGRRGRRRRRTRRTRR